MCAFGVEWVLGSPCVYRGRRNNEMEKEREVEMERGISDRLHRQRAPVPAGRD